MHIAGRPVQDLLDLPKDRTEFGCGGECINQVVIRSLEEGRLRQIDVLEASTVQTSPGHRNYVIN
jgi:hypothetical protein